MATYLLSWNPERWDWTDLEECIQMIRKEGVFRRRWSFGTRRNAEIGSRVFLMRVGVPPRGIFASGWVVREPYPAEHWDKDRPHEQAIFIQADFDVLLNPLENEILSLEILQNEVSSAQVWTPQNSGIEVYEAARLENVWSRLLLQNGLIQPHQINEVDEIDSASKTIFIEGKPCLITSKTYERNTSARTACLAHYGYECSVCDFDFEAIYGEIGKGFIHVHHLKPISEINGEYKVNPINDLVPVCPNCHAMLHSQHPPLTIEELKRQVRKARS
jgi:5-methylcytosine-specific restriction enzyme A